MSARRRSRSPRRRRRRVHRRDAEQHRDVAELKVAVDERDLPRRCEASTTAGWSRHDALADATLGRERDDDLAELVGTNAGRAAAR